MHGGPGGFQAVVAGADGVMAVLEGVLEWGGAVGAAVHAGLGASGVAAAVHGWPGGFQPVMPGAAGVLALL